MPLNDSETASSSVSNSNMGARVLKVSFLATSIFGLTPDSTVGSNKKPGVLDIGTPPYSIRAPLDTASWTC
jgi:hypothetical protein